MRLRAPRFSRLRQALAIQIALVSRSARTRSLDALTARLWTMLMRSTLVALLRLRPGLATTLAFTAPFAAFPRSAHALPVFEARHGGANPFFVFEPWLIPSADIADVDGDGDLDVVVGDYDGTLTYLENTAGAREPAAFVERPGDSSPFENVKVGYFSIPSFADIDADGDLDAVIGESYAIHRVTLFENTGNVRAPLLLQRTGTASPLTPLAFDLIPAPVLADIDDDGDFDLITGDEEGRFHFFENSGSEDDPEFTSRADATNPWRGLEVDYTSVPEIADVDGDGDLDMISGNYFGTIDYFENTGTRTAPRFTRRTGLDNPFSKIDVGYYSDPDLADLDGDGDLDLVVGEGYENGRLHYFENLGSPLPLGFARWQAANFRLPAEEALAEPGADPDGDGLTNLVEFGIRRNPRLFSNLKLPVRFRTADGRLALTLALRDDPELMVEAEFSDSPSFEESVRVGPIFFDPVPNDGVRTATFTDDPTQANIRERYVRLVFHLR